MRHLMILTVVTMGLAACGGGSGGTTPFETPPQQGGAKSVSSPQAPNASGSLYQNLPTCAGTQQLNKDQLKVLQDELGIKGGPPPQQICAGIQGTNGSYVRAYIVARIQAGYSSQPREQKCTYDLYQEGGTWKSDVFSSPRCRDSDQQTANDQATQTTADTKVIGTISAGQTAAAGEDPGTWESLLANVGISGISVREGQPYARRLIFTITLTNNNPSDLKMSVDFDLELANNGPLFNEWASWEEGECNNPASKIQVPARSSRTFTLCPVTASNGITEGIQILHVTLTSPEGRVRGEDITP